jgi:subtilase family serine protease
VATSFFEQMALQGQSMFSGSGDSGAFECMYSGSNVENLMDPASGYAEY